MENLPYGGYIDAELFADIHRPHVALIHFEDALCQGLSFGGFVGDLDAGFLQCPADGAPVASKLGGQFISAGSGAILFYDLADLVIRQAFLFLRISIDFGIGSIGSVGHIRIDIETAGLKGCIMLCPVFEYARGRVETRSQKCHSL